MRATTTAKETKSLKEILTFICSELKPKGKILTLFNVISVPVIILGALVILYRLVYGLGAVANNSSEFPWGVWIGCIVMVGVAFAGGAYVMAFVVHVLHAEKYHSILRMAILNGFLAYIFYAGAIFLDLGRWWNIVNPLIGNKFGVNSVLFLVAWHFLLYMLAQLLEIAPAFAEWLGLKKLRKTLISLTMGAVIFGIALSTLHQSGLGALFMMAKWKIHPLWYTEFIPLLFFISSIFAGISVVIFIGTICYRVFGDEHVDEEYRKSWAGLALGLGKACSVAMFAYFFLKVLLLTHYKQWGLLNSPMGYWYLFEVVGLVLIPCIMFAQGARKANMTLVNAAAIMTMIGVIINRVNFSMIAFKWYIPLSERYIPSWMEVVSTIAIVFSVIWVFRWIVFRTPILRKSPQWAIEQDEAEEAGEEAVIYSPQLGATMADGGVPVNRRKKG